MNIELEEVVGLDVSDDALELAAGGAQGGVFLSAGRTGYGFCRVRDLRMRLAIADR